MKNFDKTVQNWLEDHTWLLKKDIELPVNVYSKNELLLGIQLSLWLVNSNRRTKVRISSIAELRAEIEIYFRSQSSPDVQEFLFNLLNLCQKKADLTQIKELNPKWLKEDVYGTWLQHSLKAKNRKLYAVNYTSRADKLVEFTLPHDLQITSIVDPFSGSARLIIAILRNYHVSSIEKIIINDIMPIALLLGYCRITAELVNIDHTIKLQAKIRDGFSLRGKFSLVIMNPPFTRSQLISEEQKAGLKHIDDTFLKYNQGQAGLHVWAIFLAHQLMKKNGSLFSVIPSSTILSRYSIGLHKLLLSNYPLFHLYSSMNSRSYSEDSDLRELVIFATKSSMLTGREFSLISEKRKWTIYRKNRVSSNILENDWNWDRYFRSEILLKIRSEIIQSCKLITGKNAELSIKRGVEMYGPNFFFFPNKEWKVDLQNGVVIIYDETNIISLPLSLFEKILRKPVLYSKYITPQVDDLALTIPVDLPPQSNINKYVQLNKSNSEVARKKFGITWLHHIHQQLEAKQPYGYLFLIDKLGISTTSLLCHYTDEKLACTKNFYVVQLGPIRSKLLAAWLNSTLYLTLYLTSRREIGGSYGRMQIIDYMEEPLFPNKLLKTSLDDIKVNKILKIFDEMRVQKLAPIPSQLLSESRIDLDKSISDLIGYKGNIRGLHNRVLEVIKQLDKRGKSKSKR
ncbi:MAG: Eco57I restriction-modification methylase domain-containing protein [Candidatus Kariarchaeaceae archaeon]|jgi:hypothetical protein